MTSVPRKDTSTTDSTAPAAIAEDSLHPARLRLKPKALPTGYVDGGWWPRSRDLAGELPELAEVLSVRLGRVNRVTFTMTDWNPTPRRILSHGNIVRFEGFRFQDEHLLTVSGSDGQRISLLVVPPGASATAGHKALMTAARRDNKDRPAAILLASGALPDASTESAPAPREGASDDRDSS
jgi:hypothetical protein